MPDALPYKDTAQAQRDRVTSCTQEFLSKLRRNQELGAQGNMLAPEELPGEMIAKAIKEKMDELNELLVVAGGMKIVPIVEVVRDQKTTQIRIALQRYL